MLNAWVLSMNGRVMALYQTRELAVKEKEILKKVHPDNFFNIKNWWINNNLVFSPAWDSKSNTIKF